MHTLDELLKAVAAYENKIGCSLICLDDGLEWSDYIRQIKWKCSQIGIDVRFAMNGIYQVIEQ